MKSALEYIRKYKILFLIIIPAFFLFMLVIIPSGTYFCFREACGINFWGAHGHDAIWHLAIANTSFNTFPFVAPTFSGEKLYGYNYLLDFFVFLPTKLGIPVVITYFKIIPIVWFSLFTLLLVILGRKIKDHPVFVGLFLFFNYFAGSFYYLIKLYRDHSINDSSTQLPQPIVLMMTNPPFAFSLVFFLWLLILIKSKHLNLKSAVLFGFIIFMIIGLKFYGGIISIFMTVAYLLLSFSRDRNALINMVVSLFIVGFFVLAGILFFYDPFTAVKTGATFGFAPFALVHTITETPTMFYLQNLTDARYFLVSKGIGPRLVAIESLNLIVFLFFYLGTRFFGLFYIPILFLKKKLDRFDFSVILTIGFSILLTVTLVQKAEWWNTIQFFYYAIFLSTIYLSKLAFDLFQKKRMILNLVVLGIILLSIPTSFDLIKFFVSVPGASYLPKEEMEALDFLKKLPNGVVLSPLYEKDSKKNLTSFPLHAYEDTAYVAAFSGKQEFFSDELQLRLTGVNYKKRLERIQNMDCSILHEVDYIYQINENSKNGSIVTVCKPKKAKVMFNNRSVTIYTIRK